MAQAELADICGVTKAAVSGWETGYAANIRLRTLLALTKALEIALAELINGPTEQPSARKTVGRVPNRADSSVLQPFLRALGDAWPRANYDLRLTILARDTEGKIVLHCVLANTAQELLGSCQEARTLSSFGRFGPESKVKIKRLTLSAR